MHLDIQTICKDIDTYHTKQIRQGRNDLISHASHCHEVMKNVAKCTDDISTVVVAGGHDLIEDCFDDEVKAFKFLTKRYGSKIAGWMRDCSRKHGHEKRYQKYDFICGIADRAKEVIIVKLVDRYCNVRDYLEDGKPDYASEYAVQAHVIIDLVLSDAWPEEYGSPHLTYMATWLRDMMFKTVGPEGEYKDLTDFLLDKGYLRPPAG